MRSGSRNRKYSPDKKRDRDTSNSRKIKRSNSNDVRKLKYIPPSENKRKRTPSRSRSNRHRNGYSSKYDKNRSYSRSDSRKKHKKSYRHHSRSPNYRRRNYDNDYHNRYNNHYNNYRPYNNRYNYNSSYNRYNNRGYHYQNGSNHSRYNNYPRYEHNHRDSYRRKHTSDSYNSRDRNRRRHRNHSNNSSPKLVLPGEVVRSQSNKHKKQYKSSYTPQKKNQYNNRSQDYQNGQSSKQQDKNKQSNNSSSSGNSKSSSQVSDSDSKDRSKDAGHYKFKEGEKYKSDKAQYKLIKHISDGTFGRVLEVRNYNDDKLYALKVVRAVTRYIDSAKTETQIIERIQRKDQRNEHKIVRLYDTFYINDNQNFAMCFEKLGPSVYDIIKKNHYKGFPLGIVQDIFKQMLQSIGFLHSIGLTHTDLKPENVLFQYPEIEKIYPYEKNPGKYLYVPKYENKNAIKIIDFGGATFHNEHHSSIINTRQYRAPEVILQCCKWWEISDMWSIGCIVMEILTGDLYFQTHENYEHMAMIEKSCGKVPKWMIEDSEQKDEWFNGGEDGKSFNWPKLASSQVSVKRVKDMQCLEIVEDEDLRDLLSQMLAIDPNERISCEIALKHSFFQKKIKVKTY